MQTDTLSGPAEISYSHYAATAMARRFIRMIENATGRPRLLRMASGYADDVESGQDFWAVMQHRYRLEFSLSDQTLANIPADGPLICIANHPYGILDGLAMGRLMSMRRPDFKIVAHTVFRRAHDLTDHILPISFDGTAEAQRQNLRTRNEAVAYLKDGGAVAIFPGGTVSTPRRPFGPPIDPQWKTFTARMVSRSEASVVPVFFEGANSRLFQVASHVSQTIRVALLIREFGRRVGTPLGIHIGTPLERGPLDALAPNPAALMDHLRAAVYGLSPEPLDDLGYGWAG